MHAGGRNGMRRAAARLAGAFGAPPALTRRRVVVTGIGFVSPLGCGSGGRGTGGPVWASLLSGASGVRALAPADLRGAGDAVSLLGRLPCRIAGVVPRCGPGALDAAFEADAYDGAARLADFSLYAVSAARSAVADAAPGLVDSYGAGRVGASLGTGIGSLSSIVAAGAQVASGSERRVSPYFVPTILGNMAAAHVSLAHGLRGPQLAATTACAASAHAIGEAYRCVRDGGADAMLAGGSEGSIDALALVGFSRLRALRYAERGVCRGSVRAHVGANACAVACTRRARSSAWWLVAADARAHIARDTTTTQPLPAGRSMLSATDSSWGKAQRSWCSRRWRRR